MDRKTAPALHRILQDTLLTPHLSTVISLPNSGLDNMIDTDKVDDLARLYRLFALVPAGLPCLKKALRDSIVHRGKEINRISLGADLVDGEGDPGVEEDQRSKEKGKGKPRPLQNIAAQKLALAIKWVQDVLDLRDRFEKVWKTCWQSDRGVESTLNEVRFLPENM
jgi:cullin 3